MREIDILELELVSGGSAVQTNKDMAESATAWGAIGATFWGGVKGTVKGAARGGAYGAAFGFVTGGGSALYDYYNDGTDYSDGTNY